MQNVATTLEDNLTVSRRLNLFLQCDSEIKVLVIYPTDLKAYTQKPAYKCL